jgi:hypothetical protein
VHNLLTNVLEKLDCKKHILLVYDDTARAEKVEFEFIKLGLLNDESCIFLLDHEKKIKSAKNRMKQDGIDVKFYESKNLLHIYQIPQLDKDPDGILRGFKKFSEKIFSESTGPYRIVGRIISNISNEFGMSVQIVIEKNTHAVFDELDGSVLCVYDIREISETNRNNVIDKLCKSHHMIIDIRDNKETARYLPNII